MCPSPSFSPEQPPVLSSGHLVEESELGSTRLKPSSRTTLSVTAAAPWGLISAPDELRHREKKQHAVVEHELWQSAQRSPEYLFIRAMAFHLEPPDRHDPAAAPARAVTPLVKLALAPLYSNPS